MQTIKLNLIPGGVLPVVNVSQYDVGRHFAIQIYEGAASYDLTGKSVQIRGTKPDGNGFAYDSTDGVVSVSGSTVTISTTQQMTAVGGQTMAELRITQSGVILGTLNFVLMVEPSALSDDTPISDTDIPAIERDFEAALAEAEADALKAEGYAVGTQDGTPAQSGEPYYEDNAKYYKEQAEAAASGGGADALKAEGYAVGTQNGVPVTSESPYYHNNAAYYEGEASTSATNAATSETNAGLSETAAGNSATSAAADALVSEGWAVGEQNGTPVTSGSPYYHNNAEYYKDQAAQYAAGGLIFKGSVAFASIPTTGMVNGDMYNITDDFTTDNRFIEGSGVSVKAGADIAWVAGSVNKWDILALGGGSDDYSQLINKPQINSVELNGNKTPAELGLAADTAMTGASAGSAGAKGLVPAPAAGDQDKVLYGDGTWKTPSGGSDMTGATASTPGTHGLVPAPAAGDNTKFLRGDGTWAEAGGGGGGFVLADWLTAGGLNPMSYADLAAVLADEKAVRKLMTIHLAVDYLAGQTAVDASVNTILTDNTCAKWINLRDYALDTLYDNALFATIMDASGKYFLGEWVKLSESPETWGPKGNVPIMTSNTAPYGTASESAQVDNNYAYKAFDGDTSTAWISGQNTNQYITYQFTNPVNVKKVLIHPNWYSASSYARVKTFKVQGSNDGANWTDLTGTLTCQAADVDNTFEVNADSYYLYIRTYCFDSYGSSISIKTLQFYGREMKVSVPVMTSNTAPYGVAFGTATDPYKMFDTEIGIQAGKYAGYEFPSDVAVKYLYVKNNSSSDNVTIKYQYSADNNTWKDIGESVYIAHGNSDVTILDSTIRCRYLRVYLVSTTGSTAWLKAQFFCENYSEYDWDADNPRHYLYDHGVELESMSVTGWTTGSYTTVPAIKEPSYLYLPASGGSSTNHCVAGTTNKIDITSYGLLRMESDRRVGYSSGDMAGAVKVLSTKDTASNVISTLNLLEAYVKNNCPYNIGLDISSASGSYYIAAIAGFMSREFSYNELWLE